MTRYQLANCYMGRIAADQLRRRVSGKNDIADAFRTAVINKRAGGMGLISGRKAFQRPMADGVKLLKLIQDVYLDRRSRWRSAIGARRGRSVMSILKVARMGHPVLREAARRVDPDGVRTPAFQKLIDDMIETMIEYEGIGLAAPQVHESVRLFVAGVEGSGDNLKVVPFVNPVITPVGTETTEDWEGCLSIPDLRGRVPRAREVVVRALDRRGKPFEMAPEELPGPRRPARDRSPRRRAVPRSHGVARTRSRSSTSSSASAPRATSRLRSPHAAMTLETGAPTVTLRNAPTAPYDGAIAAARTCYAPRVITAAEITEKQRETIGKLTFDAGHHTVYQHATFEFGLEHVSRQFVWSALHSHPFYNSEQQSQRYVKLGEPKAFVPPIDGEARAVFERAIVDAWESYARLSALLKDDTFAILRRLRHVTPKASADRLKAIESEAEKKAIETARYVIPLAAFTAMVHTISGITLYRLMRMAQPRTRRTKRAR